MHIIGLRSDVIGLAGATAVVIRVAVQAEMVNLKAAMNASSEVPPTSSSGTRHAYGDLRHNEQEAVLEGELLGPHRPGDGRAFSCIGEPGKNGGVVVPITPNHKPVRRLGDADRRAGRRPAGRKMVRQRAHRGQQGRRNSRPGDQVSHGVLVDEPVAARATGLSFAVCELDGVSAVRITWLAGVLLVFASLTSGGTAVTPADWAARNASTCGCSNTSLLLISCDFAWGSLPAAPDQRREGRTRFHRAGFFQRGRSQKCGRLLGAGKNSIYVKPGETADIYFIADKAGLFAPRCADHDWADKTNRNE